MVYSLGIDASLRSTGLSIISAEGKGFVKNLKPAKLKDGARLQFMHEETLLWLDSIDIDTSEIGIAIMEGPAYSANTKAFSMGEAYGLFKFLCASEFCLEPITPSPKELKKYLTGSGDAKKPKMKAFAGVLGCPSKQEDICDSWAAGLLGWDVLHGSNTPGTRAALEIITKIKKEHS
tara:strand:+ start:1334 stop:1864 length:531 start_codon:yes stop_codon:yes gene_type:complete